MGIRSLNRGRDVAVGAIIDSNYDIVRAVYDQLDAVAIVASSGFGMSAYLGVLEEAPTERPDGSPLEINDFYVDPLGIMVFYVAEDEWFGINPDELKDYMERAESAADRAESSEANVAVNTALTESYKDAASDFADYAEESAQRAEDVTLEIAYGIGWEVIGDFGDAVLPTVTTNNQVLSSASVAGYTDVRWRTTEPLPYTPTGTSPFSLEEAGKWQLINTGEITSVAVAYNVSPQAVLYSDDTFTALDGILYIYDSNLGLTWKLPDGIPGTETITTVNEGILTTSSGSTYTLTTPSRMSWGETYVSNTALEPFEIWIIKDGDTVLSKTLPTNPADGVEITVRDADGIAETSTLEIAYSDKNIEGGTENLTLSINHSWVRLRFVGEEDSWRVVGGSVGAQIQILPEDMINFIYPVGCSIRSRNANNPASYWGVGVWTRGAVGKVVAGIGTGIDTNGVALDIVSGDNAGEWAHTQTLDELASHSHNITSGGGSTDSGNKTSLRNTSQEDSEYSEAIAEAGGGQAMPTYNPMDGYYIWDRIA